MNLERASGLILRTRPLTETSLIIHWLTREHGRVATVAKGARRPKSPFRGKLDLFFSAEFTFHRSRRSDLHTLREVHLIDARPWLREDLTRLRQAAYFVVLLEQTTEAETPIEPLHDLLTAALHHLIDGPPRPLTVFAYEVKLLSELGLKPDFERAGASPGARKLLAALAARDWSALRQLQATDAQVQEMRQFLHGFIIYHLERVRPERAAALRLDQDSFDSPLPARR